MADELPTTAQPSAYFSSNAHFGSFAGPMRSLPGRPPITLSPAASARVAMLQMDQLGSDAVVVVDDAHKLPLGIVTQHDLVRAIAVQGKDLQQPVATMMTAAPFTLPADAPAHRATVLMMQRNASHVLLTETDGTLCNVVSRSDLFGVRGGGAETFAESITTAEDVESVAEAAKSLRSRGAELFLAGMGADALCQWMSALNDLVVMRVIELIGEKFDLPAVPWCWLVFGSEGRLEQTFSTDQDNGLIFLADNEADADKLRNDFLPFCKDVNRALDVCGFDLCKGNIMAGNPALCLSLEEWKRQYWSWMETPDPEAILKSTIFFDFRPLYGNYDLVDKLRNWLIPLPADYPLFLRIMANEALTCTPALCWTGGFAYDGGRQHPRTINLKLHGARPFVDAARIWSLTHGIWETNTGDRLRSVAEKTHQSPKQTAAEVEAFYLVQRFRFHQQLSSANPDKANRLNPADLNKLNRLMLKEAFKQAKQLQLRLRLQHGL